MRIFGILTVGFSVVLFGFSYTNKYIQRIKQLNKIKYMISIIKQKIEYKKLTVDEILKQTFSTKEFFFLDCNIMNVEDICFKNKKLFIENNEKNSLFEFINGLGKTDLNGQIKHCDMYYLIFDDYESKCKDENIKKIKLFPTMFILLGLLIIILLL